MEFHGKTVLITGASSGIGAAAAVLFARHGAQLALVGRNKTNLFETFHKCESQLSSSARKPIVITADLATDDDAAARTVIRQTVDHFGGIDVLVNSAGIGGPTSLQTLRMDEYDATMNTNVRAVVRLTQLAVPELIKTRGNIVNVSSLAGIRSIHTFLAYSMSKGALDQFTKCLSLELAPDGVRVNSVNPAVIETNFHHTAGLDAIGYAQLMERCRQTHPLGRAGRADEVASAILFLASNSTASFVTGTLLPVDGGRCNSCPR